MPYQYTSKIVHVGLVQMSCVREKEPNVAKALAGIAKAAEQGLGVGDSGLGVGGSGPFGCHWLCQCESGNNVTFKSTCTVTGTDDWLLIPNP